MEEKLKKLNSFSKIMGAENFYNLEASSSGVILQGKFKLSIVRKARKLGFVGEITGYGYVRMTRNEYTVTLT